MPSSRYLSQLISLQGNSPASSVESSALLVPVSPLTSAGSVAFNTGGPLVLSLAARLTSEPDHTTYQTNLLAFNGLSDYSTSDASTANAGWFTGALTDGPLFTHEVPNRSTSSSSEWAKTTRSGPSLLAVNPRYFDNSALGGGAVALTLIVPSDTATLNPGGAGADRVQCAAGNYFRNGTGTSIRLGLDLLLVEVDGQKTPYVIDSFVNDTTVIVRTWNDKAPVFTSNTSCNLSLSQVSYSMGGTPIGYRNGASADPTWLYTRPLVVAANTQVSSLPNQEVKSLPALFLSPSNVDSGANSAAFGPYSKGLALQLGFVTLQGLALARQHFYGRGDYSSDGGRLNHFFSHRGGQESYDAQSDPNVTVAIDPISYGGISDIAVTDSASLSSSIEITLDLAYTPQNGDIVEIVINNDNARVTLVWDPDFLFSGGDAALPVTPPGTANPGVYRFSCVYSQSRAAFLVTRTDYV